MVVDGKKRRNQLLASSFQSSIYFAIKMNFLKRDFAILTIPSPGSKLSMVSYPLRRKPVLRTMAQKFLEGLEDHPWLLLPKDPLPASAIQD